MLENFFSKKEIGSFINNELLLNKRKKPYSIISYTTQRLWKKVYPLTEKDIDKAIQSSVLAFQTFKNTTPYARAAILKKVSKLIQKYKEAIAKIITIEMGKTIREARGEVDYARGYFEWFADEATRISGYEIASQNPTKKLLVQFEPIGVCAVIAPWNFPLAMMARKISPAIAAGCSVLAKPSPETPFTALVLAAIFKEAGLAKGVLNILIGEEKLIGEKLCNAEEIRKLSFTGSTKVGKLLYKKCSSSLKKLTLELGGNAPAIVYDDVKIDAAADEIIKAKFRNGGQSCIAANRIFVQKKIYESFIQSFYKKVKKLKIGDPLKETSDLTNILHPSSEIKVKKHLKDALSKKAKLLLKASNISHPQILIDCAKKMLVFQEETFGPLAAIFPFSKDEEGINLANDTPFGLAAYVFTKNVRRSNMAIQKLNFGMIGLNDGLFSTHQIPFGGVKQSGFGREGGPYSIYEYLVEKTISKKFTPKL